MSRTLSEILTDANAILDLEGVEPTGDELTNRTNYANQAVWDASSMGQLSEFKKDFLTATTTMATISLPSDFREIQEWPRILDSQGTWQKYELIDPGDKFNYTSGDKYAYILGNPSSGYNLYVNSLIESATLSLIYQRYPSGLATLSDVCELSDPQYVVRRIESYVLYSRSDDRFPIARQMAEQSLANMMGREMKGPGGEPRATQKNFKTPLGKLA